MPRVLNERARLLFVVVLFGIRQLFVLLLRSSYGVVPIGLLTFIGSLYKEVAKTTSGTLVYRFERQTARLFISSFEKHCVLD